MSWQAGIDARLVARLLRTRQPGLIGMRIARRIVGAVEQMAGRLPLLARFPRVTERSRAGETPIVHALPAPGATAEPAPAAVAASPERNDTAGERVVPVVSAHVVERERLIERTIVELVGPPPPPAPPAPPALPSSDRTATEPAPAAVAASPERNDTAGERVVPVVSAHVVERERLIERTIVELVGPPPPPAPPAPPALPSSDRTATEPASRAEAARSALEPPSRRSRMGAPLARAPLPHLAPAAARTHTLANQEAATYAPAGIPRAPSIRTAGSGPTSASPIVAPRRAMPGGTSRPVAPDPACVLPRLRELAAPRDPIVSPRRSPIHRAGAALAHVAPTPTPAPAATARPAPAPIAPQPPASPAVPSPRARAAASPVDTLLQRADLPEIAAQVQRILERQAFHDRARRGLRR